jgi:hypothetical protein
MVVYKSYWYQSRFLLDIYGKLRDLGNSLKTICKTLAMVDEYVHNNPRDPT